MRGEYRAIYTALLHDPDFLRLSPDGKLVLIMLKLLLGPSGIDVLYASSLIELTGLDYGRVTVAVEELHTARWLLSERNVFWVRNGLRFEPSITLTNSKHLISVQKHLQSLPRLHILRQFAEYYSIPFDSSSIPMPVGISEAIPEASDQGVSDTHGDTHTDTPSDAYAIQGKGKREEGIGNTEPEQIMAGKPADRPKRVPSSPPPQRRAAYYLDSATNYQIHPLYELFKVTWEAYPARPTAESRRHAFVAWLKIVEKGKDPHLLHHCVVRYVEDQVEAGTDPQFYEMFATFFGPKKGTWEGYYEQLEAENAGD